MELSDAQNEVYSAINEQHSEVCVCEGILFLSLPLHSPARGNAIPPLCKLTVYTHAETPDLGLRRRFQRGMILINSRGVLLLRPIANKLKKNEIKCTFRFLSSQALRKSPAPDPFTAPSSYAVENAKFRKK